jgi:hypothetical protein
MTNIESGLERLRAAGKWGQLFHATRVLFDPLPVAGAQHSGVDPAAGWETFLGPTPVFEAHEHNRRGRWQQGCYFGENTLLKEYTALAAELAALLPESLAMPPATRNDPSTGRDAWASAVYRVCIDEGAAYQFDDCTAAPFGGSIYPSLADVLAGSRDAALYDHAALDRLRLAFVTQLGKTPRFLFAKIRIDLVTATTLMLRAVVDQQHQWYGSPSDGVRRLSLVLNAAPAVVETDVVTKEETGRWRGPNDARDAWVYDQCCRGVPYKQVKEELKRRSIGREGWEEIESLEGIRRAARRYAARHSLAPPAKRNRRKSP